MGRGRGGVGVVGGWGGGGVDGPVFSSEGCALFRQHMARGSIIFAQFWGCLSCFVFDFFWHNVGDVSAVSIFFGTMLGMSQLFLSFWRDPNKGT